jgi:NADH:ubiquinone oxidoreductase subunit F (NADH-binding)
MSPFINEIPYFRKQLKIVLENCGIIDPVNIEEYISRGGFSGFIKFLKTIHPNRSLTRLPSQA